MDAELARWIREAVPFCNTLVDRIVPGTGLPVFIGDAQNQLVRAPESQTGGGNYGVVRIVVSGVTSSRWRSRFGAR